MVYVKLKPYMQPTLHLQRDQKLGRRYFGPYKVLRRIRAIAYRLELPEAAKKHPVFHVSMLKRCVGTPEKQVTPLQLSDVASSDNYANLNHEDKVDLQGGSNVVTEIVDWEANKAATKDGHMDKTRRSFRRIIPPKDLEITFGKVMVT